MVVIGAMASGAAADPGASSTPAAVATSAPATPSRLATEGLATEGLARDAAVIVEMAAATGVRETFPVRVTFLGWTTDHGAVYRSLVCDPDELGGRAPSCDLETCVVRPTVGGSPPAPDCRVDATVTLGEAGAVPTVRAIVLEGRADVATFGALTRGTRVAASVAQLAVEGMSLRFTVPSFSAPPVILVASTIAVDYGDEKHGVDRVVMARSQRSPDKACIASVGVASRFGRYESVSGYYPVPFGVVICRAGI